MSELVCAACGHHNPLGSNFCSSCGAPLDERGGDHTTMSVPVDEFVSTDDEHALDEDDLAPGTGILLVRRGPNAGSRYLLDHPVVTIGRHPDSRVFLDDITVSRRHAEIRRTTDGYQLADVGSLNGTYLNRERVDSAVLTDGDMVQVGKFKLMFVESDQGRSTE
ncbi:MAG: FHA domain-containing protein [Acidimicrobiales bacterium]